MNTRMQVGNLQSTRSDLRRPPPPAPSSAQPSSMQYLFFSQYTDLQPSPSVMAWALLVCILLWISALKVTKKVKHQSLMCLSCPKTSDRTAMVSSVPWNIITLSTRYYIISSVMHAF